MNKELVIKPEDLKNEIEFNGVKYFLTPVDQLQAFVNENKDQRADIMEMKAAITSVMSLMGLVDPETGLLKEALRNGEESYFKHIIKALKDIVITVTMGQMGGKHEAKMMEKFAFIHTVLPLIEKYHNA